MINLSLWREYKLDHRVIGKKRLTYCFSDSMKSIWSSMKRSVISSTNENVLVNTVTEQVQNSKKLLRV